jgi:hypothetical protein
VGNRGPITPEGKRYAGSGFPSPPAPGRCKIVPSNYGSIEEPQCEKS